MFVVLLVASVSAFRVEALPAAALPSAEPAAGRGAGTNPVAGARLAIAGSAPGVRIRHYVANLRGQVGEAAVLGYDLFDTPPDRATIEALPSDGVALVWLGTGCDGAGYGWSQFTAAVQRLKGHPRVYGYFLADEPNPVGCPGITWEIQQRADYIRRHDQTHRSFIVVADGAYRALRPAVTHVDLVGVGPSACGVSDCAPTRVDDAVHRAEAGGIPRSAMVPVLRVAAPGCGPGSAGYRLSAPYELREALVRWSALVPYPAFDYTYSWKRPGVACPGIAQADGSGGQPDLHSVLRGHNRS